MPAYRSSSIHPLMTPVGVFYKYAQDPAAAAAAPRSFLSRLLPSSKPTVLGSLFRAGMAWLFFPEIMRAARSMGLSYPGQFKYPFKDTNITYRFLDQSPGYAHPLSNPETRKMVFGR